MDGTKITIDEVKKGLVTQSKSSIFPGYNGNDEKYISISPSADTCANVLEILYNTNFVISATDASTLTELIDLAKGVIPDVNIAPSMNTVINGVDTLNRGINDAVNTEKSSGSQEFLVKPSICPPNKELCVTVNLDVFGKTIITDADKNDKEEKAELTLTLSALGENKTNTYTHDKSTNASKSIIRSISIGPKKISQPFQIYAKLDEYVETDGPGLFGSDSASVIKIDAVKITVISELCTKIKELDSSIKIENTKIPNQKKEFKTKTINKSKKKTKVQSKLR